MALGERKKGRENEAGRVDESRMPRGRNTTATKLVTGRRARSPKVGPLVVGGGVGVFWW